MHNLDIFLHHQPRHGDMAHRAHADTAEGKLAWLLACFGQEIAPAGWKAIGLGNRAISAASQAHDGRCIPPHVEIHAALNQGAERRYRKQHHNRPIRRRAAQLRQKPEPGAAWLIIQPHFLA